MVGTQKWLRTREWHRLQFPNQLKLVLKFVPNQLEENFFKSHAYICTPPSQPILTSLTCPSTSPLYSQTGTKSVLISRRFILYCRSRVLGMKFEWFVKVYCSHKLWGNSCLTAIPTKIAGCNMDWLRDLLLPQSLWECSGVLWTSD